MLAWLYDIELAAEGIRFVILKSIAVYHLSRENISHIEECGIASIGAWNSYNFKNRLLARTFIISTHTGWFTRKVLVTPPDPEEFVRYLREHGVDVQVLR
jgi:hypothetical protein